MAVTHPTSVRNGIADHVVDQLDSGTTDAQGDLIFTTGGGTPITLITVPLQNPAFGNGGASVAGRADMNGSPSGTATGTGTAAEFELRDRDNSTIVKGSVTATGGGGDIELSNTSIASGDKVQMTSLTYEAPN